MSGLGPKILLNSACFHEWFHTLPGLYAVERGLPQLFNDELLDGLEIYVNFENLPSWTGNLRAGKKILPGGYSAFGEDFHSAIFAKSHHTVHLDDIKNLVDGSEKWLGQQLLVIHEKLGISEFTTHPDQVSIDRWQRITQALPKGITLSIENMDPRKKNFQTLSEVDQLLKHHGAIKFVFDLCHHLENGNSLDDPELLNFTQRYFHRISRIHFSVPKSNSRLYSEAERETLCHFYWHDSDFVIPTALIQALPKRIKYVIEGVIPEFNIDSVRREVGLLRSILTPIGAVPERPTGTFG